LRVTRCDNFGVSRNSALVAALVGQNQYMNGKVDTAGPAVKPPLSRSLSSKAQKILNLTPRK
jgi:hypothetical protein